MGEGADEEAESGDENDDVEDPAQLEATRLRLEDQARKYLAAQTHDVVIPSYSAWFEMSKIHPVERRALPEFFNSRNRSKTPAIYKDYRDFMINTYRLRPTEYLTVTACRRNLAGDVCAIMRVHAFLEQWGLINYQIDPEARPAALAPPFTGHFRVILDTPRGLQSLHPGSRPSNHPASTVNGAPKPPTSGPASLEIRNSIYQTTSKASRSVTAAEASTLANGVSTKGNMSYQCDTCGTDCTSVRYHSLKVKDFELCQPCYLDGRFPSTMFSGDFVKLSSNPRGVSHGSDDDWTDQEVLLLLEGIEMYDDDWNQIEDHVGTRTAQQCIRKFLELPIEDPYVATEGEMGPLRFGRIPFEQADNPVMSVVAFLAGVVGPGVAAEAAKSALHELTSGESKEADKEAPAQETLEQKEGETGASEKQPDADGDTPMEQSLEKDVSVSQRGQSSSKTGSPAPPPEGMAVDSTPSKKSTPMIPQSKVVRAAHLALKSSAKAAQTLADAENVHIRSTLASLIKLTLTKLELKMTQFEELEEILEDERKGLESARMALVNERVNLKRMLDTVRMELTKNNSTTVPPAVAQANLGTTGQGTSMNEVPPETPLDADTGPVSDGNFAQLT
ncbi:hypothetical protein SERLA73DRAFT_190409 [Serpula lacrymans var. lacrymans S7.3]|uniref:SWIRM-domain-containing protein n=2 Tax=Serpula lacrymans var. lacrymans TaxID=341189 RepID=F8QFL7_SERL3|nr:uncharacterized protein SERLADRAFT_457765 [Serpula lacrymans var. lacrymans S7.9]EGN92851.1 hypothetical protein SERLA73DRAFT_190409 [Serpula lacrymans var. lacrymans S7.3]EGO29684.1 hypothetical protein SERLADRAFT_457765 [Serpula lacrymans var. lacrymans S7.9]